MITGNISELSKMFVGYGVVYMLKSPSSKIYIGQTVNLRKRLDTYKFNRMNKTISISKALVKYGFDNFEIYVLDSFFKTNYDKDTLSRILYELEQMYIGKYDSYNNGYNMTFGGIGSNGYKFDDSVIKARQDKVGCKTPEGRERIRQTHLNKIVSEETRNKLRQANKHAIDLTNRIFVNEGGEMFIGTSYDFSNTYGFNRVSVCAIVKGRRNSLNGWKYNKIQI